MAAAQHRIPVTVQAQGGAGGLLYNAGYAVTGGDVLNVKAGAGGVTSLTAGTAGGTGGDSIFGPVSTPVTAFGGGGGGLGDGGVGGSGGGGGGATGNGAGSGGAGGQGNAGAAADSADHIGGGGGGADGAATGENPGPGHSYSITGAAHTYSEGGTAASDWSCSSIACAGSVHTAVDALAPPTDPGFGGDAQNDSIPSGGGGPGVVIIRYVTPIPVAPDTPQAPTAVAGDTRATVTVVPAGTGFPAAGYTVRSVPGGFTCTIGTVGVVRIATPTVPSCVVEGLTNGTPYTFETQASNSSGDSGWSPVSVAPVTPTLAAPGIPGKPTAVQGDTSVAVTVVPNGSGNPAVTYTVTAVGHPGSTCTATPVSLTCTVSGLTNSVSYTFTATATNSTLGGGTSDPSVPSDPVMPTLTPPGAPGVPTAVAGNGQAVVTFTAPVSGGAVVSYRVEAIGDAGKFCTVNSPGLSCTVLGLANGTPYTFQVRAINTADPSSWAGPSTSMTPVAPPSPPATPIGATAVAGTASVTASWTPVSGATSYTVTAQPGPSTCTTTTATTCVLGAVAGTTYTVTVVAHSGGGNSTASAPSNEVTPALPVVPPAAPPAVPVTLTTDKGQIALATPGQQIIVIGTGFAAYSTATVIIYSTPIALGSVVTDGTGSFSVPVTVPADLAAGMHTFLAAGVDPSGGTRQMALPVTVAPASTGSNGDGTVTQTGTLPIPAGGTITLLDAGGVAVTSVVIPGQGTYALDAATGIISFVPVAGFVGKATSVRYRITDAIGTVITGTYTAVVTAPAPPSKPPVAGKPTLKLPTRIVSSTGKSGSLSVPCRISRGAIAKCTIRATAVVSGRTVVVGFGVITPKASQSLRVVPVKITLTALGRSLAARPGGARLSFSAVVVQRGRTGSTIAHGVTTVLATTIVLPRSIHFATDSSTVGTSDTTYLRGVRAKLAGAKVVTCVGHADSRGSAKAALALGSRRAKAACAVLAKGLKVTIHTVSKGEKAPTGKNNTAAGRARNRRVDITIHN